MKKYIFIIQVIFFNQLYSQTIGNNIKICSDTIEYVYVLDGFVFSPKTLTDNKNFAIVKFCDSCNNIFYLEGLKLTENEFLKIGLKSKDVSKEKLKYSYQYENNNTTNCVKSIIFFIHLDIPLVLNGKVLNNDEKEKKLRNLLIKDIYSIQRKRSFCGKAKVEIITKNFSVE